MKTVHTPVLLDEVVTYLEPASGKRFIDATLGAGGHTVALLEKGADVTGIDRDGEVLKIASQRVAEAGFGDRFRTVQASFADALAPEGSHLEGQYDGILFDLGVSSFQLDTPERGFSFRYDAPLDMRMDTSLAVTAADLVNGLGKKELVELFLTLGEDRNAPKIVGAIVAARKIRPVKTTKDLVRIVESVVHTKGRIHPATRIFQALRMAVNSEREELKAALPSALSWLKRGGVLAVITFQSLEAAIVGEFLATAAADGSLAVVSAVPVTPSPAEVAANPRSRSAKMYIGRKLV